ncbi:PREDICTED: tenecin-3-like [Nicrophorus vespilloides]|uniref:Tenecin-3-like n=1 Tax=Nicrophorus vespilloides TaxID=110193 RepID=A0ABM1MEZ3_NICVS|nr:PREDICTED: tenecin-3-like [Nicrophorus vespilloides]
MNKYIVTLALVLIALASTAESFIPCAGCIYGKMGGHEDRLGGGGGGGLDTDRHRPNHEFGNGRVHGQGHRYDNGYDNQHYHNSHGTGHDQQHQGGYRTHGY